MARRDMRGSAVAERTLVIERIFDAPRELVFRMWTDAEHASAWWRPLGMEGTIHEMDVRPGGRWRKSMSDASGRVYWRHGVYREVVEPERLAFTYFSDDPNGEPGEETLVTLTFEDAGSNRTKLTLRQELFSTVAGRDAHGRGWSGVMERLAEQLATASNNGGISR